MHKTLSFVKLDFITIKPYLTLKNAVIFLVIALAMSMGTGGNNAVIGILTAFGSLYVSYPFAVGELNGIDTLYSTLSISRRNVVLGRYIFAVCINLMASAFGFILPFAAFILLGKEYDLSEALLVIITLFFIFSCTHAIQLPIYFKLGYAKAKLLAYLPFIGMPIVILSFGAYFRKHDFISVLTGIAEWITANYLLAALLCFVLWLFALFVSYKLSLSFYSNREF